EFFGDKGNHLAAVFLEIARPLQGRSHHPSNLIRLFLQLGCRDHQSRGRNFAEIGQRDEPFEPQFLGLRTKAVSRMVASIFLNLRAASLRELFPTLRMETSFVSMPRCSSTSKAP